ncbi:hypothetical protein HUU61_01885 [Rhodopseudomonas palustris]|nr:hypothetical protein [Rhodopseudomonas palustris]
MSEIRTVTTLAHKRDEIAAAIANYEKKFAQARADLAHITAAISIFEASGNIKGLQAYVDLHRVFRYREAVELARKALEAGPMNTRDLSLAVMKAKGLDTGDRVLQKAVASWLINILRKQLLREDAGKFRGVRIWSIGSRL